MCARKKIDTELKQEKQIFYFLQDISLVLQKILEMKSIKIN